MAFVGLLPTGMALSLVFVAFSAFLAYYIAKFLRIYFLISKFDGPPGIPILGNALDFTNGPRETFRYLKSAQERYRQQTGGVMRLWLGPNPLVFLYSAKYSEVLLNSSRHINKGRGYEFFEPWLGKGLLTSSGHQWFHLRKLLTPTFHFSILKNFIDVFNEQSLILVKKLENSASKSEVINIFPLVAHCVLDIICDTAMGKRTSAQSDSENEYVQAVRRMNQLVSSRTRNPLLWPNWIYKNTEDGKEHERTLEILHGVTNKMIRERLHEFPRSENRTSQDDEVAGKRKRIAFLDLLLQMHLEDASFTLEEIREEVDTFMFAGHDTTAAAISWALLLIGHHPEVQACLHDEIDQVFGTSGRPVAADDLSKLSYLSCVVKEALRLLPSVPAIGRTLDEDITLDGKIIPKEALVFVDIYGIQHDPEQFPDPERFDPDRFLPENATKRHPFAFIPFSAGPRNCMGQKFAMMENKVVLINILRRFTIQSLQTIDEAKPGRAIIMRPSDGTLLVKLSLRK